MILMSIHISSIEFISIDEVNIYQNKWCVTNFLYLCIIQYKWFIGILKEVGSYLKQMGDKYEYHYDGGQLIDEYLAIDNIIYMISCVPGWHKEGSVAQLWCGLFNNRYAVLQWSYPDQGSKDHLPCLWKRTYAIHQLPLGRGRNCCAEYSVLSNKV